MRACLDAGASEEAASYVPRLSTAHDKAYYLVRLGRTEEARAIAALAKDAELVDRIDKHML